MIIRRLTIATALSIAVTGFLGAQTFDVASIKSAPTQAVGHSHSRTSTDTEIGRLTYSSVTLRDILIQAYAMPSYAITGPDWIDIDRFDITTTFPAKTPSTQVAVMLQALLADRFGAKIHREAKELPVYALEVAKSGHKLKAAESASGTSSNSTNSNFHLEATTTMQRLAEYLSPRMDQPVQDRTGLQGAFEFKLDWTAQDLSAPNNAAAGPSIFTALQEQLGLKLNATKGPVESIVVDQANRTPTEN